MPLHCTSQGTCWGIVLTFLIGGFVDCQLIISIPGSSTVSGNVGDDITLRIEYSGAANPTVEWTKSALPIATWTIGSSLPPEIAPAFGTVRLESDGSLTFQNVQPQHSGQYTVRLSKSGVGTATAMFTLRVFDLIQNVSISAAPEEITEGSSAFSLQYSTLRGDAESVKWFFKGTEIKNGTRYTISDKSLKVNNPTRADSGQYSVVLTNPLGSATAHKDISVLFGPEQPVLKVVPQKDAYEVGDSLTATCGAEGDPAPSVSWAFDGKPLPVSPGGTLNLTNVKTTESGVYTCVLVNDVTGSRLERNITINIYENPTGSPECSVAIGGNVNQFLQYRCRWPGGTPQAQLSFPALNASHSGKGDFILPVTPRPDLNGKEISCEADHPLGLQKCSVTARGPDGFIPVVSSGVDSNGLLVVTITCASTSVPIAKVTWFRGGQVITSGDQYQISPNTTVLTLRDPVLDTSDLGIYSCKAANLLGQSESNVHLLGPKISTSSLVTKEGGTVVTLTWETPPASVVTGFEVQMAGPDLKPRSAGSQRRKRATDTFRTVQTLSATARSTELGLLEPGTAYQFRAIPFAGRIVGEPSKEHHVGPGGLSEAAIAGIATGVVFGVLLLLLLLALIICCVCCKRRRRETRYPVSRAVEKAVSTQPNMNAPHKLLTGGMKSVGPPDYYADKDPSERATTIPSGLSPAPVRMATTV